MEVFLFSLRTKYKSNLTGILVSLDAKEKVKMPRKRKDRRRLQMAKNHGKGYDRRQTAQTHEIEPQDSTRNFCLTDDSELEDFSADDSDEHSQNESESSSISAVDAISNIELPQITQRKDTLVNHGAVQTNGRLYIEKKVTVSNINTIKRNILLMTIP